MCEIKKIKCLNKSCIMILSTPSPRGGKPLEYEVQNLLKIFTLAFFSLIIVVHYFTHYILLVLVVLLTCNFSQVEVLKIIIILFFC